MKSAYELAMERLAKQSPQPNRKLTEADKVKLAELDRVFTARIAEVELELTPKIAAARAAGQDPEAVQKLEETFRSQVAKLRRQLEEKKDAIRQGKPANA